MSSPLHKTISCGLYTIRFSESPPKTDCYCTIKSSEQRTVYVDVRYNDIWDEHDSYADQLREIKLYKMRGFSLMSIDDYKNLKTGDVFIKTKPSSCCSGPKFKLKRIVGVPKASTESTSLI